MVLFSYSSRSSSSSSSSSSSLAQEEFCLSLGYRELGEYRVREEAGLVALYCDRCREEVTLETQEAEIAESQVLCSSAKDLFTSMVRGGGERITSDMQPGKLVVGAADTNGDWEVDFEEFYLWMRQCLETAFNVLDASGDGSIYDEAKAGTLASKIPLKLLYVLFNQTFGFLDANKDQSVGLEDFFSESAGQGRRGDNIKTMSDRFDTSLISLPAPLYNLYSSLDTNRDKKLTDTEAHEFLARIFAAIDTDWDCDISVDEVSALLQLVEASPDNQLAVRMILHQYLALGSYLFHTSVQGVDENRDSKVTLEEVLGFKNLQFVEDLVKVALGLGQPGGAVNYLGSRRPWGGRRGEKEQTRAMWLTALQVTGVAG